MIRAMLALGLVCAAGLPVTLALVTLWLHVCRAHCP